MKYLIDTNFKFIARIHYWVNLNECLSIPLEAVRKLLILPNFCVVRRI